MVCELVFYELPYLKEDKNFCIYGSILTERSLSRFITEYRRDSKVISDFQFQRPELYKKIKINFSQLNILNFADSKKYTYLQISFKKTEEGTTSYTYYYYYIMGVKQIGQSTIEFELKMDVLNTFDYVSARDNTNERYNYQYTLSDKTLIQRQHKDRIDKLSSVDIRINSYGEFGTEENDIYWIDGDGYILDHPNQSIEYKFQSNTDYDEENLRNSEFQFEVLDTDGNVLWDLPWVQQHGIGIYFYYDNVANTTLIRYYFMIQIGGIWQQGNISYTYNGSPADLKIKFRWNQIPASYIDNQSYIDQLKAFVLDLQPYFVVGQYYTIIDRFPEGIDCVLFHNESQDRILIDDDGFNTWYIAYSSANNVVQNPSDTEATYVNPVKVAFYSDNGYSTSVQSARIVIYRPNDVPQIPNREEWLEIDLTQLEVGGYVKAGGITFTSAGYVYDGNTYYQISIKKKNNTDQVFEELRLSTSFSGQLIAQNFPEIEFYGLNYCNLYSAINGGRWARYEQTISINSGSSSTTYTSAPIKNVDLTEPKLIKIINVPYAPRDDLVNIDRVPEGMAWASSSGAFELVSAQDTGFDRTIYFTGENPTNLRMEWNGVGTGNIKRLPRHTLPETKLSNSDFSYTKFVYDSFTFDFRKENIDLYKYVNNGYDDLTLWVRYVVSGNINSKFMFQFLQYVCDRAPQDYNDVLVVERNNEIALYTNAFINYIRSGGFEHDSKNADMQKLTNGLTIALSTIGAIGSFASAGYTGGAGLAAGIGLTIGTATKIISSIHSAQQADRAISQKLLSSAQQSTSVSTSEDITILKAYSDNKAKLCHYRVSDYMLNSLYDLFYYFGYRCHDYEVPNVNTRCNFNFVQADIVYNDHDIPEDIANEIANKWKQGITFFHENVISGYANFDIKQEYENTENTFIAWEEE